MPKFVAPLLYRKWSARWIAGVCAGLADITGIRVSFMRGSFLAGLAFYPVHALALYIALVIFVRSDSRAAPKRLPTDALKRRHDSALARDDHDIHELELRLRALEMEATSQNAETRRRFREAGL